MKNDEVGSHRGFVSVGRIATYWRGWDMKCVECGALLPRSNGEELVRNYEKHAETCPVAVVATAVATAENEANMPLTCDVATVATVATDFLPFV